MTLRTGMRYRPDTCECSVFEQWDDAVETDPQLQAIEHICDRHLPLLALGPQAVYEALYEDNRRKNTLWSLAKAAKTSLADNDYGSRITWSFGPDRVLTVNVGSDLSAAQKTQLQNAANSRFGAGKVVIL